MKKVGLNAGHDADLDSDRGFAGTGYEYHEGRNNFLTCVLIKGYLESKYEVEVLMSRNNIEDSPSIAESVEILKSCDLLYSRHSNAYNGRVRGCEAYAKKGDLQSEALAKAISKKLSAVMGNNDRGMKSGDNMKVVNMGKNAGIPLVVMAEIGFHDNPLDAELLVEKRVEIAEAEAEVIAQFMDLPEKVVKVGDPLNGPFVNEAGERLWFRAVAGSYETRAEAMKVVEDLKKSGKSAWLQAVYVKGKNE